ncbi:TIGR01621 family pseudouridine synthase [Flocculibacter collagenilyticus]|uniref:TIGR01621 family pseudouridine synthase n=1 Tax=Flocculibacter collagenilyticus TaxID=2744479 RepID=UPI0018F7A193|nr:TIGR01621 family pseudouridine synthase [Flocculibacter collagenilyticus]
MFDFVFENNDFIVVDKHPDVSFHCEEEQLGLFEAVKQRYQFDLLYPVHRLDKMTSGLVIFAKSKHIAAKFGELFEAKKIEKFYLAISEQKPKKKQGLIKGDMKPSRRSAWKLMRTNNNPAISQFFSHSIGNGLRLYLVKPHTGKTHQIRVALNSIGAPILGDELYASASASKIMAKRGYLHAYAVKFELNDNTFAFVQSPNIGMYYLLDATQSAIKEWQSPWQITWPAI